MKPKQSKSSKNILLITNTLFEDFDCFDFIQCINPLDLTDRQHYTSTITGKKNHNSLIHYRSYMILKEVWVPGQTDHPHL